MLLRVIEKEKASRSENGLRLEFIVCHRRSIVLTQRSIREDIQRLYETPIRTDCLATPIERRRHLLYISIIVPSPSFQSKRVGGLFSADSSVPSIEEFQNATRRAQTTDALSGHKGDLDAERCSLFPTPPQDERTPLKTPKSL